MYTPNHPAAITTPSGNQSVIGFDCGPAERDSGRKVGCGSRVEGVQARCAALIGHGEPARPVGDHGHVTVDDCVLPSVRAPGGCREKSRIRPEESQPGGPPFVARAGKQTSIGPPSRSVRRTRSPMGSRAPRGGAAPTVRRRRDGRGRPGPACPTTRRAPRRRPRRKRR